jgi:hypothetical protein
MELLITAVLLALVLHGLNRNQARQPFQPHPHLTGSTDVQNRDKDRLTCDLQSHP